MEDGEEQKENNQKTFVEYESTNCKEISREKP